MKYGPERRVRKRPDFQAIQKAGRRVPTEHFVLIVALGAENQSASRLGITASRRVGNSVRRSRLKRLVRAAFQATEGLVPPEFDLVVICRKDRPDLGLNQVLGEWEGAKKRLFRAAQSLRRPEPAPPSRNPS